MTIPRATIRSRQGGVTLIELMVAIVLMLLITFATVALYSVNSSSKRTIDASQGLDDTARFVFELVGQGLRDAGYANGVRLVSADPSVAPPSFTNLFDSCAGPTGTNPCPVIGYDNSLGLATTGFGSVGSGAPNQSDSLAVWFYGASQRDASGVLAADGTVVTCNGRAVADPINDGTRLGLSVFSVALNASTNEPELLCTDSPGDGSARRQQPIASGVESFQVMYAIDRCTGGPPCTYDGVPDLWVSASDMGVADWAYVKAVRIGMVLRGAPGSSQARDGNDLYPFGKDFVGGSTGNGGKFTPPTDTRLRREYSTTYLLRNSAV